MPTRPFMVTGVDYAGPFQLRESRRRGRFHVSKSYVALFICFSTKAVHLEVVTSLTSEAFIAALSRFTARRGLCAQLFSDNGTNFVGASRELQEVQEFLEKTEPEIKSFLVKQRINWSFIPPRSPHFGGIWESAVKLMKRHLYTITQGKVLTYEEFNTLVAEIEAVLNSRPLTPLTSDPSDFNHLQKLRQQLWQRWQREYLQELQKRSKWFVSDANVGVNTLVLLIEDNAPPFKWPLGRVVAVHPGADAKVRVVTVKTSTGSYKRAVKKICPLPLSNDHTMY
ncbi:uncharacterized protein LOC105206774 [Solenopsis invicta]|uniref:uncharacterized protein LOC105206774 n=1 Tax=Solenopsis invicta TaxID=13686 RepID=UPI00193D17B0|nr:uncharacterized protein LOC105206774 [Solenopsis invicta]